MSLMGGVLSLLEPIPGETEINRARLLAHMIMNIRPALGTTPAITLNAPD